MWTDAARGSRRARRATRRLVAGLLLASAAHVCALSTDSDQPIAIEADRAEHDDARRVTVYRGEVVIDRGSLRILGDTVTVQFDGQGEVTKLVSVGAPAHFRQLPDGQTRHRKGWAKRMEYFPQQDLLVLFEDARYETSDGSRVQADRLVYDSLNARFKALTDTADKGDRTTGGTSSGRVRIRIAPQKDATP